MKYWRKISVKHYFPIANDVGYFFWDKSEDFDFQLSNNSLISWQVIRGAIRGMVYC